ncbi:hypothetical protein OIU34_22305 [Pararhizobium sp. BT-229]|uniref:hypothetical protein n=1 Tax=Pararhizobium sp. BT-229 TaxID=2986923 RepID=UPI0021F6C1FC|nr:hypothetical protein [Pararhizobium sp. BT-229]MCV9964627.1 hypothetical protein [Pararhizobium sp. BT-229]
MAVDRADLQKMAIEHYISLLAGMDAQAPFGQFMLDYGSYHVAAPRPPRLKTRMPTRCFSNAQRAVVAAVSAGRKPLTYAEGYACSSGLAVCVPIHHAWLIDDEGRVVDQTWQSPETSTYFGVAFSTDYVMAKAEEYGRAYNSLIDDRRDRWRLLNDPSVAAEAIIRPRRDAGIVSMVPGGP